MARSAGALLCLAVAVIHVKDQGGLTMTRDPHYIGVAYWTEPLGLVSLAVEGALLLLSVPLLVRSTLPRRTSY
ncbi:hypothetical protein E2C11_13115 [Streptomyces lavendulae]|nr:hypothetical protein [Streptomyces lavendulae]TXJ79164.1 hypothetical protein E2C11_13115 [Streptomyces lavendulae]